ncbi:MAG: MTAP family purine nucleoside phosphorylase [Tissierellia bacterium]|nr:MTAP family purine nucleoside phosphorylase [Tissierellia bacterium]
MIKYGLIAGTGFDNFDRHLEKIKVVTKYGTVLVSLYQEEDFQVAILNRHGNDHVIPPHKINYRNNIAALHQLGVQYIYGICAVGSLHSKIVPGDLVLIEDFLDMTKNRITSFYNGEDSLVKHLEVSKPYSEGLSHLFLEHSSVSNIHKKGIYVCTEGPRFESRIEIKLYQSLGCHVVGMTNIPEVLLANEKNISYACISYVTNYCTGVKGIISADDFKKNKVDKDRLLRSISSCFKDPNILNIQSDSILL